MHEEPDGASTAALRDEPDQRHLTLHVKELAAGRYVVGAMLGSGGMGTVHRATDRVLHREVAIKLLADNLAADWDARERFLREARAAAAISDPNVVAVYDVGEDGGRPYLVMQLVDGPSLADVLKAHGPLDVQQVERAAHDALQGLAATHAAGIVHRDIKPGNLLLDPQGKVRLTDLGVALAADTPSLTHAGMVIGTRSYLAPERRQGEHATPRTDLYALGITLVELLIGRTPTQQAAWAVQQQAPAPLKGLLGQLLAEAPDARPEDAAQALALLDGARWPRARASGALERGNAEPAERPTEPYGSPPEPLLSSRPAPSRDEGPKPVDDQHPGPHTDGDPEEDASRARRAAALIAMMVLAAGLAAGVSASVTDINATDRAVSGRNGPSITGASGDDGVPRGDDPASTARALAEWLRDRLPPP